MNTSERAEVNTKLTGCWWAYLLIFLSALVFFFAIGYELNEMRLSSNQDIEDTFTRISNRSTAQAEAAATYAVLVENGCSMVHLPNYELNSFSIRGETKNPIVLIGGELVVQMHIATPNPTGSAATTGTWYDLRLSPRYPHDATWVFIESEFGPMISDPNCTVPEVNLPWLEN